MGYSQNNESEIIARYFDNHIGTFADFGCNDGITLSNTYDLALKGWKGLCLDASPLAIGRCIELYQHNPSVQIIHAALTNYNGEITLNESGEHLGNGDVSLLSTVIDGEKLRWPGQKFTTETVPCINFSTLMGLSKFKTFDFISMDIEGCELSVLPQMDLRALGCKLLCVEFNGKEQEKYDAIVIPQGYKLIHKNGENLIYSLL